MLRQLAAPDAGRMKSEGCCRGCHRKDVEPGVDVVKPQGVSLYPVSVEWRPPFSMLVPLKVPTLWRPVKAAFCHLPLLVACCRAGPWHVRVHINAACAHPTQ